jgi:hypothetical protein
MKKTLLAILPILLSLSVYAQQEISKEEARAFMETYLEDCLQNKYSDDYDHYFDMDQKGEEEYLINEFFHQYRILSVRPPWVDVLTSFDTPEKWDRIYSYQLKKKGEDLFILPRKIRFWTGANWYPHQQECTIGRSFSEDDFQHFKDRTLAANDLEESDVDLNYASLLGEWVINECAACNTYSQVLINRETLHFKPNGQFGEGGNWFVAEDHVFIRFPDKVTYKDFKIYPLRDASVWISHESKWNTEIGMHLVRKGQLKEQGTNVLLPVLLPKADILIQPVYDALQCITPNRIIFTTHGKKGLMDSLSNIIIPTKYDKILITSGEDIMYATVGSSTHVLDSDGNLIKTLDFTVKHPWMGNQYCIEKKGKVGMMDSLGNILIEPIYDDLKPGGSTHYTVCKEDQWGLIDLEGKLALPLEYDGVEYCTEELTVIKKEGRYGVINIKSGAIVIPIEYDRIKIKGAPMILGLKEGTVIPYQMDGSRLLNLEYDYMEWMGWNYMGVEKDGKRGVINELGEIVLPIQYDDILWADLTFKGLFDVRINGETVTVDSTGMIIPKEEIKRRKALVDKLYQDKQKESSNDEPGSELSPRRIGSGYALFNAEEEMILPPVYERYPLRTSDGHLIVDKNAYTGLITQEGTVVLPFIFQDIYECTRSGIYIINYQGKKGLIRI